MAALAAAKTGEMGVIDRAAELSEHESSVSTSWPAVRDLAGRYRLGRCLGQGGMATVYVARDLSLERGVAVKLVRDDVTHPGAAELFYQEARLAAGISHPNVVTIHDFGVVSGRGFLVMELLVGITLREELLARGRMPVSRIRKVLSGICAALDEVHKSGLVHRDLKPENVMLTGATRDVVKILDFGIATRFDDAAKAFAMSDCRPGTLRYMAPEQIRGEDAEGSSDLWTLGVLTFEMLTGKLPFTRPISLPGRTSRFPKDVRPLRCWNLSAEWERFFAKALALDPKRRMKSASEFLLRFGAAQSRS